ncbi:hypothetical protein SPRG_08962 [Saprolegnia parasitica CBS 223.65]|uniref:Uncharacterized protein n=1 Tax=Saprolegnia parasitica (strain CBS 223.65) TaxID=695850 RepID=A0A067C575_SAPPC|nr:hypothetical protein SPRG_08962 [Saprolegnia parasitica CBS 223.65]KDO25663.1 hypothetical protein SPRG_08962 [Saprolegnia parasitica CBS 223.65]|eukprot:XP_012203693.1 hypothetical protein SPRG_08962 [Saprolegnia parasitica CBS 223.65]
MAPDTIDALDRLGFQWPCTDLDLVTPATRLYQKLACLREMVPAEFVVSRNNAWPTYLHGVALGKLAEELRVHLDCQRATCASSLATAAGIDDDASDPSSPAAVFTPATIEFGAMPQSTAATTSQCFFTCRICVRGQSKPLGFFVHESQRAPPEGRRPPCETSGPHGASAEFDMAEFDDGIDMADDACATANVAVSDDGTRAKSPREDGSMSIDADNDDYDLETAMSSDDDDDDAFGDDDAALAIAPEAVSQNECSTILDTSIDVPSPKPSDKSDAPGAEDCDTTPSPNELSLPASFDRPDAICTTPQGERAPPSPKSPSRPTAEESALLANEMARNCGASATSVRIETCTLQPTTSAESTISHDDSCDPAIVSLALKSFYALYSHQVIPIDFCVPRQDARWPRVCWGLALGSLWARARTEAPVPPPDLALTMQALGVYYEITGPLHVSPSFVVPSNSTKWPRHLWGLSLRLPPGTETPFGRYHGPDDVSVDWAA